MESHENLIYGIRAITEAITGGKEIQKVLLARGQQGNLFRELFALVRQKNLLYQFVPVEKLNRLVSGNHQGAVCFISEIHFHDIQDILAGIFEKGENPLILVLDRVTDVRNFGAIARSAECCGVHAILVPSRGAAPLSADAVKTSAGALNTIPVCRSMNLKSDLQFMHDSGLKIVACTEKASLSFRDTDYTPPLALIMGSEDEGISDAYFKWCDEKVKIPLLGKIGSLNVSVASGVMLYEVLRQRGI